MITRGSVRRKSAKIFKRVIELRKRGLSYTEIMSETGIAKSTINNWLNLAGLTLTKEHLQIQIKKRSENHILGTVASKITRARRKEEDIQKFVLSMRQYFDDSFFVAGIMLYEAEGTKTGNNSFSNSDFRLILMYVNFLKKYLDVELIENLTFRIYIHDSRFADLERIKNFWAKKLSVQTNMFKVSWKHNVVTKRRENKDYVGQMSVVVKGLSHFAGKMVSVSDIILARYTKS